jgi:DNA mismatch repair ATPase MutS
MQYRQRIVPLIRDMFTKFYVYREHWTNAVNCIAELDALCSLAVVCKEDKMVRPVVLPKCDKPYINIK